MTETETEIHTESYSLFVPDLSQPCHLIGSTADRYNDSVRHCLAKDSHLIQQTVDLEQQSTGNNYFRNAKWSPDGSFLLTNSADDVLRLFQLPQNVYEEQDTGEPVQMAPNLGIREGEAVYDFAWFPTMNAQDPSTCCFITSVRDHPIQLWDACTGSVRASYRAIDHCERFVGPNVLCFNLDGSKIYTGYENMIEIFDTYSGSSDKKPTIPKRKSRHGQKGIISCLDFAPDGYYYAAGSYSASIGIYDAHNDKLSLKLTGIEAGVTQVKFSKDGLYLFSASRHSDTILCWDIRDSANVLYELPRPGRTNQRIQFDLDPSGKYLITGDTQGNLLSYDITTGALEDIETKKRLVSSVSLHQDIISSVSFNPVYPVMSTCSGQRKFSLPSVDSDESEEEEEEIIIDNTLKTWRVPGQYEWYTYEQPLEIADTTDQTALVTDQTAMTIDQTTMVTDQTTMITETTTTIDSQMD
ncbi:Telomerase Cajal body protein 1 [Choanephora cucurbitarum]|uniref:Telomerase Cajal body protein 1 n=1 Tax=Choanephora cucurbitarum TaxID=101091 RepID=A0A1C7NQG2_9FUNG|nr:Telomerase Cajal body protein 1 [Choanephora cucurbitarum]